VPAVTGSEQREYRDRPSEGGHHVLLRQSTAAGIGAVVAVASGLLLDVAIAAAFGAGRATDAFFVAARIPFGIIAIVTVAANQMLVPAFTTSLEHRGEATTWRTASVILVGSVALSALVVAVAAVAASPLIALTAPGLDASDAETAEGLSRVTFLIVPPVVAAEVLRSLLNARRAFVAPASMHIVLNVIAAAIVLFIHGPIAVVAWAYVAGSLGQTFFMYALVTRRGFRFGFRGGQGLGDVWAVARLSIRPLLGAAMNPLARVGEQAFVSFLPTGSISILNYGYRLVSAIGGSVLFRSVTVALLPRLTSATARGERNEVARLTRLGVRMMFAVSSILTPFMAVLATPAAIAVFNRGDFSRADAVLLGFVLAAYSGSLIGSGVQRALLAPAYARLDTRTPLRNTVYGVSAGLAMVPVFVLPLGERSSAVVGVAIAYSLSQYVHVAHAWMRLRAAGIQPTGLSSFAVKVLAAAAAGAVVLLVGRTVLDLDHLASRAATLAGVAFVGLLGAAAAAAVLTATAREEVRALRAGLRRSGASG